MPARETLEHALISATDKTMVRRLGHGLLKLGGWEIHSYGGTKQTLEGILPPPPDAPEEPGLPPGAPLAVSDISAFIGEYDERDRPDIAARLANHLTLGPEELCKAGLPRIDLVYMNPLISRYDAGFVTMMEAALETDKIVIAKMRHVDPVLDWLAKGRPDAHEISLESLQNAAKMEIALYTGSE